MLPQIGKKLFRKKPTRKSMTIQGESNSFCTVQTSTAENIELDIDYYKKKYGDLSSLSESQLREHWLKYGFSEGRFASASHEAGNANLKSETEAIKKIKDEELFFDSSFYASLYSDLKLAGIINPISLEKHYKSFGYNENRYSSIKSWLKRNNYPLEFMPDGMVFNNIYTCNTKSGLEVSAQDVLNSLTGAYYAPVAFFNDEKKNAQHYLMIAKHFLSIGNREVAKKQLEASNYFFALSNALELLGNIYLEEGHNRIALGYYNAAKALPNPPKWLFFNRATCLLRLQQYEKALTTLAEGLEIYGDFTFQQDKLDEFAEEAWNNLFPALLSYVSQGNRYELIDAFNSFSDIVYDAYLRASGSHKNPKILKGLNTKRILIIGDYHVAQCERYRINQKIEQLESVGKEVTAINWLDIDQYTQTIATHDVIIFYRVPAMPKILKAMAQTNAAGKLSIYEIDDLLFDPVYPPALASYGGYVSLDTHRELTRGMALFHAAARQCRLGIASTEPLRERLADLVYGKECLLHRNGLDSLNEFSQPSESPKQTLDIFYGSGTQAHNQDFIDLALPAIEKLLKRYDYLRLVVVGYLKLPNSFTEQFASQLSMIPPLKSVQGYWSLLSRADINLAVLHDDVINECKSELKWFEAACHGVPSVVSSTRNYRDVIRDGEDAFLAVTADDWEKAITRLVESKELRKTIGQAAQNRTREEYSLEILGNQLLSGIENYVNGLMDRASLICNADGITNLVRKRRKIALVNVFFPPQSIGGATRVLHDNFKALRKYYDDDIELVAFTADSECRHPHQLSVYSYNGVPVYRTTTLWRENMDWHAKDERMYKMFTEFLKCEQPDMVHFHCVQRLTGSVVEAASDAQVPYIVTAHDAWWISDFQFLVDHKGRVYPEGHPDPFAPIELPPSISQEASVERKIYLKGLLSRAYKVLTVSEAFSNIYYKNNIDNIEVIPNGISDDISWTPKDTGYTSRVVIGHVGGMAEHKGYYLLKQSIMEIQPSNVELIVVDHSKDEGFESRQYWGEVPIKFIGRINQNKVVDVYSQIDVLFAPSTWPESFGLVTREAVACKCWIVASSLGGIGEGLKNSGFIIAPRKKDINSVVKEIDSQYRKYKGYSPKQNLVSSKSQLDSLSYFYLGG